MWFQNTLIKQNFWFLNPKLMNEKIINLKSEAIQKTEKIWFHHIIALLLK